MAALAVGLHATYISILWCRNGGGTFSVSYIGNSLSQSPDCCTSLPFHLRMEEHLVSRTFCKNALFFSVCRFVEAHVASEVELSKPWRVKILQELRRRLPEEGSGFEKYEKAVEM